MNKVEKGRLAESIAVKVIESWGGKILQTNYYCRFGEIDLICEILGQTVFVEVKSLTFGLGLDIYATISNTKLRRIQRSIQLWFRDNPQYKLRDWRLDFIGIEVKGRVSCIHHLQSI